MNAQESLLSFLLPYQPADEKEVADKARMIAFADSLKEPLSRAQKEAHFTGSAIIVHPDKNQVCLVYHGKYHRWIQLGGHGEVDDHGDISATALREAKEESGLEVEHFGGVPRLIDIDVHPIQARGEEPAHFHLDMRFLFQAKTELLVRDPNESEDVRWLPWAAAMKLVDADPSCQRMLQKAQKMVSATGP
jgi:8-oxo-dGTP pyrophosphatase MutT (NUDIX family)